jgi:autotransporter-associated beta strand protein
LSTFGTLGSGAVLLGDTTGTGNATLNVRATIASGFANNITVRAGSSGTKTITTNQTGGVNLAGTVTLEDNLTITTFTDGTFSNTISGTGDIVKTGNGALTFSGDNTFTGDLTVSTGAFTLAEEGSFTFKIGANNVGNQINGATAGAVALDGTFIFDLSGASLVDGNSWALVSISAAETYGENFSIAGFAPETGDVWSNGAGFTYTESTGVLAYTAVPEPSTVALLGGFGSLFVAFARRRKIRA